MSSVLRTIKRGIERDEFKKKHGYSLSKHKKNEVKRLQKDAFKLKEKETKTIFKNLKKFFKKKNKVDNKGMSKGGKF